MKSETPSTPATGRTALALLALLIGASTGEAQVQASEAASVSQTVDGTKITVTYSRPRARGRTGLFGTRIHWGEVWTPGANAATTLAVSRDVTIEGQPVPKGKYSVWLVAGRERFELLLDKDTMLFHTQRPKARAGQVRFPVGREKRPFMEALTWSVPEFNGSGLTLALHWDTVYVPLRIKVTPSFARTVSDEVGRRVAGAYRLHFEPFPMPPVDPTVESDTTDKPPTDVTFTIRHERGELRAVMDPPMARTESGYSDWILVPSKRGGGWYHLGRFDNGELVEIMDYFGVQFAEGERAGGFEVRLPNDKLMAKATRIP